MVTLITGAAADGGRIALAGAGPVHGLALLVLVVAVLVGFVALIVHLVRRWRRQKAWSGLTAAAAERSSTAP